jgi:2-polyprenyl-3-methyl-5-hydroxy-6-metoxy-1,4-benzoquinol methylase
MSLVSQREREKYETAWTMGGYGDISPGEKYLPIFIDSIPEWATGPLNIGAAKGQTLIDIGTGSGKGAEALCLKGFNVALFDITFDGIDPDLELVQQMPMIPGSLWKDLSYASYMAKAHSPEHFTGELFDWAYCCDVMEHIPTEFTMLCVQNILNIVQYGVFFSISLVPDQFGYFAGEPLHKTVQPFTWWRDNLAELGNVTDARDLGHVGTYLVRTK